MYCLSRVRVVPDSIVDSLFAIEFARRHPYALIWSSAQFPGFDGLCDPRRWLWIAVDMVPSPADGCKK